MNFYHLSTLVGELFIILKDLMGLQLFRYRFIVDNSPSGIECPYAKTCMNQSRRDNELQRLRELGEKLTGLLGEIEQYTTLLQRDEELPPSG